MFYSFASLYKETTHKQEYWKHCGLTVDWVLTQCPFVWWMWLDNNHSC